MLMLMFLGLEGQLRNQTRTKWKEIEQELRDKKIERINTLAREARKILRLNPYGKRFAWHTITNNTRLMGSDSA